VDTKLFPHRPGTLQSLSQEMGSGQQRSLWLWRGTDNVSHRQQLSFDKVRQWSAGTEQSRCGCIWVAEQWAPSVLSALLSIIMLGVSGCEGAWGVINRRLEDRAMTVWPRTVSLLSCLHTQESDNESEIWNQLTEPVALWVDSLTSSARLHTAACWLFHNRPIPPVR